MMSSLFFIFFSILTLFSPVSSLNRDGILLLSFKYSILGDPLSVLQSWNYDDLTPCSWTGVTCSELGVTDLVLPKSQLLGSITPDLGLIQHLKHLDLSNNFLNGSLPDSLFNSTEMQVLSLSGNEISGELPESIGEMKGLQVLNLSDNALAGQLPKSLTSLQNLTVLSLKANYISGVLPAARFNSAELIDFSSNLFNGSLPLEFAGQKLKYLNLSYNKLTGSIPPEFGNAIPENATLDLSFNNLTGEIPGSGSLLNQKTEHFRGNLDLCGKPLKSLCSIPSTLSNPPNVSKTSPAIAVIPKPFESSPVDSTTSSGGSHTNPTGSRSENQSTGLKPGTIVAIAAADFAGIGALALIILYVYRVKKKKATAAAAEAAGEGKQERKFPPPATDSIVVSSIATDHERKKSWTSCLKGKTGGGSGGDTSESTNSFSDSDPDEQNNLAGGEGKGSGGKLVMVDGDTELEIETLLKATAYILGSGSGGGGSIVYKAVLGDGTAFAVRRIGEVTGGGNGGSDGKRMKEFEGQVRQIAKLRHPNLVKVRGFCWGDDEKLVICDYISGGSLATSGHRRAGTSPFHLPLEVRFKIARGLARGLAFIHDKKQVHGNIKPSNILLGHDMDPIISDFGLDRLINFASNNKTVNSSGRNSGSQRSVSGTTPLEHHIANNNANTNSILTMTASPYTSTPSSSLSGLTPYQAPESLKTLKPNPKWDVYSFGAVLLELLTGRVFTEWELSQWAATSCSDDRGWVTRLTDVAIRAEVEVREDAVVACLKLGFNCACFVPQKRPSMKEAVQVLEKIPPHAHF
ncbi:Receptor protein kinase-like protein At4g34220 [Linum grandiflorum]